MAGTSRAITWSVIGNAAEIAHYKLALSTDGGATFPESSNDARQLTPSGIFGSATTTWSWTVPSSLVSSTLRIRVGAMNEAGFKLGEDTSDTNFSVVGSTAAPTVSLSSPDGGETWTAGGIGSINWSVSGDSTRISAFAIEYSTNGGAAWSTITSTYPSGGARPYRWNVPSTLASTQARVRLRALDVNGSEIHTDTSAANFTIAAAGQNLVARPDCSNIAPVSGQSVRFDGVRSSPAALITSYSWNFHDGKPAKLEQIVNYTFTSSMLGTRTVSLTVTDNLGRTDTSSLTVNVNGNAVGSTNQSSLFADPVNLATGNFTYDHTDVRITGPGMPFEFKRYYNSKDSRPSAAPLGFGWSHSYHARLEVEAVSGTRMIIFGDGRTERYEALAGGLFAAEAGIFSTLSTEGGGHVLLNKAQTTHRFDAQGRLTAIVDKNGNTTTLAYGASGTLDTVTDTAGRTVQFAYDATKRLISLTDALARVIRFAYDAAGDLVTVTDARGGVDRYEYDASHQMTAAFDPKGHKYVTNVYDSNQRIVTLQKDALGNETTFEYDFVTRLTTVTDPLGQKSLHLHDDKLRVIAIENARGDEEAYEYDAFNNRTKVINRNGHATRYAYDARGNVTLKVDPLQRATTIEYDARNNPTRRADALGGVTAFTYDAKGNLLTTTDAGGGTSSLTYNAAGLPLTQLDSRGHARTFSYNVAGDLVESADALGGKTAFTYDAVGRRLTEKDALNRTTTFAYDTNDNVVTVVDPAGTLTHTYDANDKRETTRDRRGNLTTFTYDAKDRLTSSKDALNQTVSTAYDSLDRKISVTDARANTTLFAYDAAGNLSKVTDALGKVSEFAYDPNGNRISARNPLNQTTTFTFDALDRLIATADPLGNTTRAEFDALGRKTKAIDALGRATIFEHDPLGRLTKVTDAAGGIVLYTYDTAGNRLSMSDPNRNVTTYTYDALNRLIQTKEPSNGIHENTYDAVGNLASRKDPNGNTIRYTYDASNRRTGITYPAGAPVTFSYDADGNRTGMTDSLGVSSYQYDVLNRMTSATDAYNQTVGYTYDPNGNRASLIYPGVKTVAYTYDAKNQMKTVTDWLANVTTYTYDDAGNLKGSANKNGTTAAYTYDAAGRLTALGNAKPDAGVISSYSLTLDAVGNHTQVTQNEPLLPVIAAESRNYTYDSDSRLTTAGETALTYDANGNLTAEGADTYSYNFENRLQRAEANGSTCQYRYDGDGNRKSAVTAAGTKRHVLDLNSSLSHVLIDIDGLGSPSAYYIQGRGLVSRIESNGAIINFHYDNRGSTVALTDSVGVVTDVYAYGPFGKTSISQGATANQFKYVGKYGVMDEDNGLAYVRSRYYKPSAGRFISKDAFLGYDDQSQSLNRYVYAMNNPVTGIDVSGFAVFYSGLSGGFNLFAGYLGVNASAGVVNAFDVHAIPRIAATGFTILVGGQVSDAELDYVNKHSASYISASAEAQLGIGGQVSPVGTATVGLDWSGTRATERGGNEVYAGASVEMGVSGGFNIQESSFEVFGGVGAGAKVEVHVGINTSKRFEPTADGLRDLVSNVPLLPEAYELLRFTPANCKR